LTDLGSVIVRRLSELPPDVQLVVGIPRSGLLAANLIALYLDVPLTDVEGFLAGRVLAAGSRGSRARGAGIMPPAGATVLVVDDSVSTGSEMRRQKARLSPVAGRHDIRYLGVFVDPDARAEVDLALEEVSPPRIFEWNVMHSWAIEVACVDMDGVLCDDPTDEQNDDGAAYRDFLDNVRARFLPSRRIGWIVTSRLEKYRGLTRAWLDRHGVMYDQLVMVDLPDKAARDRSHDHATYKGRVFRRLDAQLFVESAERQAPGIAAISGKPVWCVESRRLYGPAWPAVAKGALSHPRHTALSLLKRFRGSLSRRLRTRALR